MRGGRRLQIIFFVTSAKKAEVQIPSDDENLAIVCVNYFIIITKNYVVTCVN